MEARIKKLWVEDLRANPDKQGKNALMTRSAVGDKYCCLGRLCELYATENPRGCNWREPSSGNNPLFEVAGSCSWSVLPLPVVTWAGLTDTDPLYAPNKSLSAANDGGLDFPKIADLIEANF